MFDSDIHLNLYSEKAYVIARLIKKALHESTAMPRRTSVVMRVERELTNETVIHVNSNIDNYYWRKSKWYRFADEHEAKDWLANYLKRWLIKMIGRSEKMWSRSNHLTAFSKDMLWQNYGIESSTDIVYSDIYYIYDYLKERSRALKMYSAGHVAQFKGEARNPLEVELLRARNDELKRLNDDRASEIAKANTQYNVDLEKIKSQLEAARMERIAAINAEYDKKEADVNKIQIPGNELAELLS